MGCWGFIDGGSHVHGSKLVTRVATKEMRVVFRPLMESADKSIGASLEGLDVGGCGDGSREEVAEVAFDSAQGDTVRSFEDDIGEVHVGVSGLDEEWKSHPFGPGEQGRFVEHNGSMGLGRISWNIFSWNGRLTSDIRNALNSG